MDIFPQMGPTPNPGPREARVGPEIRQRRSESIERVSPVATMVRVASIEA